MSKKTKKFWYLQDGGTYSFQIPVFVGYTIPEVVEVLKKQKGLNPEAIKEFVDGVEMATKSFHGKQGGVWSTDSGWSILFLPSWEGSWNDIETLVHECFHLTINMLGRGKMMINCSSGTIEEEAIAYNQEYLWRNIRRRLEKAYSLK